MPRRASRRGWSPRRWRATRSGSSTSLAIAYAVGASLLGGTTQFVIAYLIGATGDAASPARYVVLTSIVTICAMWALPESRGRALER